MVKEDGNKQSLSKYFGKLAFCDHSSPGSRTGLSKPLSCSVPRCYTSKNACNYTGEWCCKFKGHSVSLLQVQKRLWERGELQKGHRGQEGRANVNWVAVFNPQEKDHLLKV